jgi:hypothetical protein
MSLGFVYKWINKENNMFYIGSHKGNINDGYIGSGVYFKRAYNKDKDLFEREILYTGCDFLEVEELILKTFDAENNNKMYNLKNYAIGGKTKLTEDGRKRLSESKKGNKNPNYGKSTWNKGKEMPSYVKEAISKAQKNRIHSRDSVIKRSKYLVSLDGINYLTIKEASNILGYKDVSTISEYVKDKKNKKLNKLIINIKKL